MINGVNEKQAFKEWRTTQAKRGKIPDDVWEQVKELLSDYTPPKIGIHLGSIQYKSGKNHYLKRIMIYALLRQREGFRLRIQVRIFLSLEIAFEQTYHLCHRYLPIRI